MRKGLADMDKTALIIGASRGVGLGLVREYGVRGWRVTATERSASPELHATGAEILTADVTERASIAALAEALAGRTFDLAFVVAGVWGPRHQDPAQTTSDEAAALFMANSIGPVAAAMALASRTARGGTIAFMTSEMGSIAGNRQGGAYLYRASKAALNAMAKSFALSRDAAGRTVLVIHPGWVRTDMGGPSASITTEQSARGVADVLAREAGHGGFRFLDWRGQELAW